MAYTKSDIDRIDAAISGSELSVQFADGKRVQYRSLAELTKARRLIQSQLDAETGERPPRSFRVNVGKGL